MLSPEDKLLICCADLRGEEEIYFKAQEILSQPVDGEYLIQKANRHGVGPLLYSLLSKIDNDHRIPDEIMEKLKRIYHANAFRNKKLEDELLTILRSFHSKAIDCIGLKGLFILKSIYEENMALRPVGDIDLLVHFKDLSQVDAALLKLGYSLASDYLPAKFYHHFHFHVLYLGDNRHSFVHVEIHFNIKDQFNLLQIDIDKIWERAVPWEIGDTNALTMCQDDLLAYLCYHADKHGCYSKYIQDYFLLSPEMILNNSNPINLIFYAEILKLIQLQGSKLNWALFIENCQNWGIEGEAYSTLTLINKIFDASIAAEVLSELNPPKVRWHHAKLYPILLGGSEVKTSLHSLISKLKSKILSTYSIIQFGPPKYLDLSTYLFPDLKSVSRYYSTSPPFLYFYYLVHVCKASFRSMIYLIIPFIYYIVRKCSLSRAKKSDQLF